MVSVSAVAIAFLTIGYFFKIKEIKSPEMTEVENNLVYHKCVSHEPLKILAKIIVIDW